MRISDWSSDVCSSDLPSLVAIARKHSRSVAQIMIRWHTQLGNMVIPKSVTPSRLKENFHIFDFALDAEDLAAIAALDKPDGRDGPPHALFRLPTSISRPLRPPCPPPQPPVQPRPAPSPPLQTNTTPTPARPPPPPP